MIAGFFKNLIRVFAVACIIAALYLNIIIIPDHNKGILIENTQGIQLPLLNPGYHWNWTRFVPMKWSVFNVDTSPSAMDIRLKHPLRYGRYMEDPDIFSVDIVVKVKYRLTDNSVLFFWKYFNKNVNEYPEYIHERVKLLLETFMADVYKRETDVANLGLYFRKYISNEGNFKKDWNNIFAEEGIELLQYDIVKMEIPEAAVYLENIKNIDKIFEARREATRKKIIADATVYERKVLDKEDLEKAREFGKIMKDFPDIVKYYEVEKINPRAKVIIKNNSQVPLEKEDETVLLPRETVPAAKKANEKKPVEAPQEVETGKLDTIQKNNTSEIQN